MCITCICEAVCIFIYIVIYRFIYWGKNITYFIVIQNIIRTFAYTEMKTKQAVHFLTVFYFFLSFPV